MVGACDEEFGDASCNIGEVKAPEKRDGNALHEDNSAPNVLEKDGYLQQDSQFTSHTSLFPTSESVPNYNSTEITLTALLILAILAKLDAKEMHDHGDDDDVQEEFPPQDEDIEKKPVQDEEFSYNHGTTHHQTAATEDTTALEKLTEEERDTVESHGTDYMQSTAVHDATTTMGDGTVINPATVLGAAAPPTELNDPSTANVADDIKTEGTAIEEAAAPLIEAVESKVGEEVKEEAIIEMVRSCRRSVILR
ncbi:hypothetical protein C0991_001698 [Blastosporella zonata]|nr:hypothetical protein C0991_001698 [Blastosporella zonata]